MSNDTGNVQGDDLSNSNLSLHIQERYSVGVSPLVWINFIVAGAQTWAENLAMTGNFAHDPTGLMMWVRILQALIRPWEYLLRERDSLYESMKRIHLMVNQLPTTIL